MPSPLTTIIVADYRHVEKVAVPLGAERSMKWYDLREQHRAIDPAIREAARVQVAALIDPDDVGFVILHLCGQDVVLLLVSRWRNDNELWEAVFAQKGDGDFVAIAGDDPTRATFCVWELGIVNFERLAWAHLLRGPRDDAALETYLAATYEGVV
jgi:hypothetical protein